MPSCGRYSPGTPKNVFKLKDEALNEAYEYFDKNIRSLPKNEDGKVDQYANGLADNDVDAFRHAYVSGNARE